MTYTKSGIQKNDSSKKFQKLSVTFKLLHQKKLRLIPGEGTEYAFPGLGAIKCDPLYGCEGDDITTAGDRMDRSFIDALES